MENYQVAKKFMLKRSITQWVRGSGLRQMAAVALLLVVLIFVPTARTESNTALASNADQPTSPGLNCSDRGITLTFTAPTQTSPTVTNYE